MASSENQECHAQSPGGETRWSAQSESAANLLTDVRRSVTQPMTTEFPLMRTARSIKTSYLVSCAASEGPERQQRTKKRT